MATNHPSRKLSKLDESDMSNTAGEVQTTHKRCIPADPGRVRIRRPARTYLQQLSIGKGCNMEDLPAAMDDRDVWRERERERERVRKIHASGTT